MCYEFVQDHTSTTRDYTANERAKDIGIVFARAEGVFISSKSPQ